MPVKSRRYKLGWLSQTHTQRSGRRQKRGRGPDDAEVNWRAHWFLIFSRNKSARPECKPWSVYQRGPLSQWSLPSAPLIPLAIENMSVPDSTFRNANSVGTWAALFLKGSLVEYYSNPKCFRFITLFNLILPTILDSLSLILSVRNWDLMVK